MVLGYYLLFAFAVAVGGCEGVADVHGPHAAVEVFELAGFFFGEPVLVGC